MSLTLMAFIGCGDSSSTVDASSKDDLFIIPKERVGLIRTGMTLDAIERALGPSQDPSFGNGTYRRSYPEIGLSLSLVSDGSNVVKNVECGSLETGDPLIDSCKHSTTEGIGMGSTREQIISVYGQPSSIKTDWMGGSPDEGLFYESIGIRFILTDGQVHSMMVFL